MGFRFAWVLAPVSVGLGLVIGCATQATDSAGDDSGGGDTSSMAGASGASTNGGGAPAGGTSAAAGQSSGGSSAATAGASGAAGVGNAGASGNSGASGSAGVSGSSGASGGGSAGATAGGSGGTAGSGTAGNAGTSAGAGGASGSAGASAGGSGGNGGAAAGGAAAGGAAGSAGSAGSAGAGGSAGIVGKMYTLNHFVIGSSAASAAVNVTWNADHIEFVFVVQDATPEGGSSDAWNNDAVEIYLDPNNGKTTTFQSDDCEIVVPRLTGTVNVVGTVKNAAAITVVSTPGSTAYTLDVTVPWTALNIASPPLGQNIGLNLAVDDDTNGGGRDAQLMLDGDQFAYNNPSEWGTLLLD